MKLRSPAKVCLLVAVLVAVWALWEFAGPRAVPELPPAEWSELTDSATRRTHGAPVHRAAAEMEAERASVSAWRLSVRVVDRTQGAPLPAASVVVRAEGGSALESSCDEHGRAVFEDLPGERGVVEARRQGFDSLQVEVDRANAGRELRMALSPAAGWIRGIVRNRRGDALGGVDVCAWPVNRYVTLQWLVDSLARQALPIDTTAEDGTFALQLEGDHPSWSLAAAGAGFIAEGGVSFDPRESSFAEIVVHPVYACRVRWLDADGGPLRVSPALREGSSPDGRLEGTQASPLNAEWWGLALVGVTDSDLRLVGRNEALFAFADREGGQAEVVALRLSKTAPGYQPADGVIDLPRIRDEIPRLDYRLQRRVEDFSLVIVDWSGEPGRTSDEPPALGVPALGETRHTRQTEVVTVKMKGSLSSQSYGFAVWSLRPERQELGRVPCGEYSVWLDAGCGRLPASLQQVRIEGDRTVIRLPLSKLGGVEVAIVDRRGSPYEGLAVFHVESARNSRGAEALASECAVSFVGAPYRIEGLPAGPYKLRVQHPEELRDLASERLEIADGATTSITLRP